MTYKIKMVVNLSDINKSNKNWIETRLEQLETQLENKGLSYTIKYISDKN